MLTFVLGFFMSLGKAAVYKHIPVYYPGRVGPVGGVVGLIGGLGGFVLPIAFGAMNDLVGVWTSCFMLLFLVAAVSLALDALRHPQHAAAAGAAARRTAIPARSRRARAGASGAARPSRRRPPAAAQTASRADRRRRPRDRPEKGYSTDDARHRRPPARQGRAGFRTGSPKTPASGRRTGKRLAWRTLTITTANLIMAFIVWFVVSALVVQAAGDRLQAHDLAALLAGGDARARRRDAAHHPHLPHAALRHAAAW